MKAHPDCKCGFWLNSGYEICPLKECKRKELFQDVVEAADSLIKELNETCVVLIDSEEKRILVDQITKV